MWKYEKQFRKQNPQTVGETDSVFDLDNYKDWLEEKLEKSIELLEEVECTFVCSDSIDRDLKKRCNEFTKTLS